MTQQLLPFWKKNCTGNGLNFVREILAHYYMGTIVDDLCKGDKGAYTLPKPGKSLNIVLFGFTGCQSLPDDHVYVSHALFSPLKDPVRVRWVIRSPLLSAEQKELKSTPLFSQLGPHAYQPFCRTRLPLTSIYILSLKTELVGR